MPPFDPTTQDDEVLVRDADGTFRVVRMDPAHSSAPSSGAARAPSAPSVTGAILAPEERVELDALSEKVGDDALLLMQEIAQRVASAIIASGITLKEEVLTRRLEAILSSRLHHVRNDIETREMLMRTPAQGGMGFSDPDARRLLALLHGNYAPTVPPKVPERLPTPPRFVPPQRSRVIPTPVLSSPRSAPTPPSDSQKKSEPVPPRTTVRLPPPPSAPPVVTALASGSIISALPPAPVDLLLSEHNDAPAVPTLPQKKSDAPPRAEKPPVTPALVSQKRPEEQLTRPVAPSSALPRSSKPVVRDVAFVPRLVGPIEELHVTRKEWDRLGETPDARAKKIEEKIERLGTTATRDRIAGMRAWRSSEVMRMYQDVMARALAQKKTVADVLRAHPIPPDSAENRPASAATGSPELGVSPNTPRSASPVSLESGAVSAQKRGMGWALKGQEYTMEDILAIAALNARLTA